MHVIIITSVFFTAVDISLSFNDLFSFFRGFLFTSFHIMDPFMLLSPFRYSVNPSRQREISCVSSLSWRLFLLWFLLISVLHTSKSILVGAFSTTASFLTGIIHFVCAGLSYREVLSCVSLSSHVVISCIKTTKSFSVQVFSHRGVLSRSSLRALPYREVLSCLNMWAPPYRGVLSRISCHFISWSSFQLIIPSTAVTLFLYENVHNISFMMYYKSFHFYWYFPPIPITAWSLFIHGSFDIRGTVHFFESLLVWLI